MKRKSLIARKKVKKTKALFKDPKIQNFYLKFKSAIYRNIKRKNFALAVSGGSDSLCLSYFSKVYSTELGNKIHVLFRVTVEFRTSQSRAQQTNAEFEW